MCSCEAKGFAGCNKHVQPFQVLNVNPRCVKRCNTSSSCSNGGFDSCIHHQRAGNTLFKGKLTKGEEKIATNIPYRLFRLACQLANHRLQSTTQTHLAMQTQCPKHFPHHGQFRSMATASRRALAFCATAQAHRYDASPPHFQPVKKQTVSTFFFARPSLKPFQQKHPTHPPPHMRPNRPLKDVECCSHERKEESFVWLSQETDEQ